MLLGVGDAVNLTLGVGVSIGEGTLFGPNVVVFDGTVLGAGCVIEPGAVLGKTPRLARSSTASRDALEPLRIGARVTVCTGAVIYAGSTIADEAIVGDQSTVRERSSVGEGSVVGRGTMVDNEVVIGARVKLQTNVYVTGHSVVEDDVFVGPGAMTTNDDTMARCGPGYEMRGATLRRACRVGGGAVLTPGVEVGEEAFIAAGAIVTRDVQPRAFMVGAPARKVREVRDDELLERWR